MKKGARIGGYELLEPLGSGGAGSVFKARSPAGEVVALKILHHKDEAALARFERERRLLGSFGEPEGFVPLTDSGTTPHGPFLVMPFVSGGTLRDRLERGPLAIDQAVALAIRLARALGRAHEKGIVHRDVKPENILFRDPDTPLLADLGLAKHYTSGGESPSLSLSKTGVFKGTAGYMPPEQMRDAKLVGPPADVFALGAVLYECVAGEPPFQGETGIELMAAVEIAKVPPLASVRADAPHWLSRVVEQALARPVEARFQDGHRFADALEARKAARRAPWGVVGALVVIAGLAGVGAVAFIERSRAPVAPPEPKTPSVVAHEEVDLCRGFRAGKGFKLEPVFGRHDWKHAREVYGVAISPDGTRAVTCGGDARFRAWDTATGREVWTVAADGYDPGAVAFSPSGDRIVTGSKGPHPRILDAASGKILLTLEGHEGETDGAAWSPDGKRVLTVGGATVDDARITIKEWDAANGALLHTIGPPTAKALHVAYAADGKNVFSVGNGGELISWDLARGVRLATHGGNGRLNGVAVLPDGRHVLTSDNDREVVTLWDLGSGERKDLHKFSANAWSVAVSADGKRAAAAGWDGFLVWDMSGPTVIWEHPDVSARAIALTPDGSRLLTGHQDGVVRFWDVDKKKELGTRSGFDGPVVSLGAGRGRLVGVSLSERHFEVREARHDKLVVRKELGNAVATCAVSPDASKVAVIRDHHPNENVPHERFVYDAASGALIDHAQDIQVPYPPRTIAFSPNNRRVLIGDANNMVSSFDLDDYHLNLGRFVNPGLRTIVYAVAFLDDSVHWISGDERGGVTFADTRTGTDDPTTPAGMHRATVTAVAARHHRAVTGDQTGAVKMWDAAVFKFLKDLVPSHERAVTAAVVSDDAKFAATASEDGTIAIWDLVKAERAATIDLATSTDWARTLLFDGDRLHVGTSRGVVLTFELAR